MSTLKNILEKYKKVENGPLDQAEKGEGENNFIDTHTDNVSVFDGPGVEENIAAQNATSVFARAKNNMGYDEGESESVYEQTFTIEDIKSILHEEQLDAETIDHIENSLLDEEQSEVFMQIVSETIQDFYDAADEEEQALLDEMLATEEGYEEFLDMIFEEEEEECEECGDSPCSCDEDED